MDHWGMTEIGPAAIECESERDGLHLLEDAYVAEVIDPMTLAPVPDGIVGELVITTLARVSSPLLRYRTGDLVRAEHGACRCGVGSLKFRGGILGRTDDMVHVRGNNVYPAALEALIQEFPEVAEFRIDIDHTGPLAELEVAVEPHRFAAPDLADRIATAIRDRMLFRANVRLADPGTLPRFEMKAKRVHHRHVSNATTTTGPKE
jgi:phenylacetate-CoA ligase